MRRVQVLISLRTDEEPQPNNLQPPLLSINRLGFFFFFFFFLFYRRRHYVALLCSAALLNLISPYSTVRSLRIYTQPVGLKISPLRLKKKRKKIKWKPFFLIFDKLIRLLLLFFCHYQTHKQKGRIYSQSIIIDSKKYKILSLFLVPKQIVVPFNLISAQNCSWKFTRQKKERKWSAISRWNGPV